VRTTLVAGTLAAALVLSAAAEPAARKPTVGLVVAGRRPAVARAARAGLLRAQRELGVTVRFGSPHVDLGVVVGPGRPPRAFPGVRSALVLLRMQEPGYLAGYLAGLEAERAAEQTVSTIGDAGGAAAGFRAGARAALPGVQILSGEARDAASCRAVALDQIARGSFVVLADTDVCGSAAVDAARQHYVWAVAAGADADTTGPRVLTSCVARFDLAVYDVVAAFRAGRLRGGAATFGLGSGVVALGPISAVVPTGERAQIRALTGRIRRNRKVG
jgi:basic membrane lipoprotein Med (substrate-binding protein (PBP1-ABC) superfamily)